MLSIPCHFIDVAHEKCQCENLFFPISISLFSLNLILSYEVKGKHDLPVTVNAVLEAEEDSP